MKRRFEAEDFETYRSGLSPALSAGGEAICRRVWAAIGASRKTRPDRYHGSARIASKKAGRTREAELFSEYNVYKLFEYWTRVLWYAAQPKEQVKRVFATLGDDGKVRFPSQWGTMDAFVFWGDKAPGWVDIKTQKAVDDQIDAHPGFYVKVDGLWRCPSGDDYAAEWGLTYTVIVIESLSKKEISNAKYLASFIGCAVPEGIASAIWSCVADHPGIPVGELRRRGFSKDDICIAILSGLIYVDLLAYELEYEDAAFAYLSPVVAAQMPSPVVVAVGGGRPGPVNLKAGEMVLWLDARYEIVRTSAGSISFKQIDGPDGRRTKVVSRSDVDQAIRSGAMSGLGPADDEDRANLALIEARFDGAGPDAVELAEERLVALQEYWARERIAFPVVAGKNPALATVREWQTRYWEWAEIGCGFAGLLERPNAGRPGSHLAEPVNDFLVVRAAAFFDTPGRKPSAKAFYRDVLSRANKQGIKAPSYPAILTWLRGRPIYESLLKSVGHKGAASKKPWVMFDPDSESPNGQYPGQIAHGDATVTDIWVCERFTRDGALRPSLFRLVDGFSGKKLGQAWHFGEVDEGVVLEALADQIRKFGFLSEVYVLDNALVHKTTRVQKFLALHGSEVKYRLKSSGRGGLPVERRFGAINTDLFNAMMANTQISKNARAMDRELDPRNHAIWPLAEAIALVDKRDALVEHERVIQALRQTTDEAWDARFEHGMRQSRLVRWSAHIEREMAVRHAWRPKVSNSNGIWVNRLYYWDEALTHPRLEGVQVTVRIIRGDIGAVWVFVPRHTDDGEFVAARWVRCVLRSPIARFHLTYLELSFFTKVVLAFNEGHYRRKQVEDGKLGDLLVEMLEREGDLIAEQAAARKASGRTAAKRLDLPRGDVLGAAREPLWAAPVVPEDEHTAVARSSRAPKLAAARVSSDARSALIFGSKIRHRADDFEEVGSGGNVIPFTGKDGAP